MCGIKIQISNMDEILNVITELSMVTSNPGEEKRLFCSYGYKYDL